MKVVEPGHLYTLNVLDDPQVVHHILIFVKRIGERYPGNDSSPHPGTTSQEVLRCLLDRAIYVNRQIPCWQTRLSIHLYGFLIWLYEHRAAKRHHRKPPNLFASIYGETCSRCGHVGCWEGCR